MTQWGLDNLFNPGKRHMDDEKRRLQSTREEVGDNSGGRRIDLEAGKVSITVQRRPQEPDADSPDSPDSKLAPALAAEDLPEVGLANDDAEITPDLVPRGDAAAVEGTQRSAPVVVELADAAQLPASEAQGPADTSAASEPSDPPPPPSHRRRQLSANAWSRRG